MLRDVTLGQPGCESRFIASKSHRKSKQTKGREILQNKEQVIGQVIIKHTAEDESNSKAGEIKSKAG